MRAPSSDAAGSSPVVTAPSRPSGIYSSPLHLDGAGSQWHHTGDPGSPLDDTRSLASSTRSSRRRRGAPEMSSAAGEGKEWSQTFMDLERMQRENKERMQGSVRSGRSSPGDEPFFRSGSTSSCRSSVRRRRWGASSFGNGAETSTTTAPATMHMTLENGANASRRASSPVPIVEISFNPSATAGAPRLVAATGTMDNIESAAVAEPNEATGAGSPLNASTFSPKEGEEADAPQGLKPRLSGLPMWLKRRQTASPSKKASEVVDVQEAREADVVSNLEDPAEEKAVAASEVEVPSCETLPTREEGRSEAAAVAAPAPTSATAAAGPSESSPTSPIRKARGASSLDRNGEVPRRSPLPPTQRDAAGATSSTSSSAMGAAARTHQSGAAASPLMQTYLARHTRAAASALAAAAAPSRRPEPSAEGGEVAVDSSFAAEGKCEDAPQLSATSAGAPQSHSTHAEHVDSAAAAPPARPEAIQLAAAIAVDKDAVNRNEEADITGPQSAMQTSTAAFPHVTAAVHDEHAAARKSSDEASTLTANAVKAKHPARVVRQDISTKRPAAERSAELQSRTADASAPQSVSRERISISRDRPSVSRTRPSASLAREHPAASVPRELREASHMCEESSVPRPSRPRRSSVLHRTHSNLTDTAESSMARASRERSAGEPHVHQSRLASEKPHDGPSSHLQRSTALFDMRRQQVLLDRQERERKAALEERARLGMITQTSTAKKKVLANTTGLSESRDGGAAATLAKEKAATPTPSGADLDGAQTVKLVRRPASTPALGAANGRPRLASASALGERRTAAGGGANPSTTTLLASPTAVVLSGPAPPSTVSVPSSVAASEPLATSAAVLHPRAATTTTAGAAAATPTAASSSQLTTGAPARKPIISATSSSPAPTGPQPFTVEAVSTPTSSTGTGNAMKSKTETRPAALSPSAAGPAATESAGPAVRTVKPALTPTATRAQLHRAGVSTRRELTSPNAGAAVRRTERRVSTKMTALTAVKSPAAEVAVSEKTVKPTRADAAESVTSLSAPQPSQASPSLPAETATTAAVPATVEAPIAHAAPIVSSAPTPAPAELRPAPFCVECGQRHVDDAAKFCAVCGHKRIFL